MPTPQQEMEKLELLKKYKDLLDANIITEEEFNEKKKELLATKPSSQPNSSNNQANHSGKGASNYNNSTVNSGSKTSSSSDLLRYLNNQQKGTSQQQQQQQQAPKVESNAPAFKQEMGAYGMKWYNFLVKFALIASAILNIISGIMAFLGLHYNGEANLVYTVFPNLRLLDIFYGLALIGLAIMAIATRQALYWNKRKGPTMLCALYVLNAIFSVVYTLGVSRILEASIVEIGLQSDVVIPIVVSVTMVIANYFYFEKRKDMFTY